jgi:N-acetylmuramoyl-L-alanine amidase
MPAVLCEVGFISNQREEELINTPWFQKTVAKAICDGIADYFSN